MEILNGAGPLPNLTPVTKLYVRSTLVSESKLLKSKSPLIEL